MTTLLVVLAILTGLTASHYLTALRLRQLMVVLYHVPFRFTRPYTALYDALETKLTYELLGGKARFKSHSAFLAEYRKLRPQATKRFTSLWNKYAKQVGRDYGLVLLVALGLFWSVWWAFLGPFLVVQLVAFVRLHFGKRYRADFFAVLVVSLMLSDHSKHKETSGLGHKHLSG